MNYFISFIRLFLPIYGLVVIRLEEKRKHHEHNRYLLILFSIIAFREILNTVYFSLFGEAQYFTEHLAIYYILSFIPVLYFSLVLMAFLTRRKGATLPYFVFSILVIISLMFLYMARQPFTFPVQITYRLLVILMMVIVMFRLNTTYLEEESNIITKNKLYINALLTIFIFQFIFYFTNNNIVKQGLEIAVYSLMIVIMQTRIREGYEDLTQSCEHLGYEKEIFINLLQKVGSGLTSETNFDKILGLILDYSVDVIKSQAAAILLVTPDKQFLTAKFVHGLYPPTEKVEGYAATKERFLVEKFKNEKIPIGKTYLGEVAQSKEPLLVVDARENEKIIQTAPDLMDIKTLIVVPLMFKDEVIGVVSFLNKTEGGNFQRHEFQLARTLAEQAAITLNNFRLYNELLVKQRDERELEIAAEIQKNLLPKQLAQVPGLDLFAYNKSAKGVGGDYYDLINFDNKRLSVIIADVAGKGVPASLVMVMIRTTLHNILRPHLPPKDIITYLNKFLSTESTQERYATLFYLLIDLEKQNINFTNAGHSPLLLYRKSENAFESLDTAGLPLGIVRDQKYEQNERQIQKGDILMLYTDGITEAMSTKREQFSLERVKDIIRTNQEKSAEELTRLIQTKLEEFCYEAPQHDDQTLILCKLT